MSVAPLRSPLLNDTPHGFLGRLGGVSTGIVAGLNVGHGADDDPAAVAANRRIAVDAVAPGAALVTPYQVHAADCVVVTDSLTGDARPRGDALVTDRTGIALGIVTADCAPVLFVDAEARVIGAAHAGWRGALAGVTDATLDMMETLGARRDRIAAAIGPCIGRASYEVDAVFADRFLTDDPMNERFFMEGARAEHFHFDLGEYVAHRLAAAGVGRVDSLGIDTYRAEDAYFSYRRATHRGEGNYGRQLSLIALD